MKYIKTYEELMPYFVLKHGQDLHAKAERAKEEAKRKRQYDSSVALNSDEEELRYVQPGMEDEGGEADAQMPEGEADAQMPEGAEDDCGCED